MKCPIRSSQYAGYIDCAGDTCMLTDDNGNCLIRQALKYYVDEKREAAETRAALEKDPLLNALFNRNSFSK